MSGRNYGKVILPRDLTESDLAALREKWEREYAEAHGPLIVPVEPDGAAVSIGCV